MSTIAHLRSTRNTGTVIVPGIPTFGKTHFTLHVTTGNYSARPFEIHPKSLHPYDPGGAKRLTTPEPMLDSDVEHPRVIAVVVHRIASGLQNSPVVVGFTVVPVWIRLDFPPLARASVADDKLSTGAAVQWLCHEIERVLYRVLTPATEPKVMHSGTFQNTTDGEP